MEESSASASMAGYGYQYERALYRIFYAPNASSRLGIETADDIEEISETLLGKKRVTEQAKLTVKKRRNTLGNSNSNLWKTLRIWLKGLVKAREEYDHLAFILVTNQSIRKDSLAKKLSDAFSTDEVAEALLALQNQALKMSGKNRSIANDVLSYSDDDLTFLIYHIRVEDNSGGDLLFQKTIDAFRLPEETLIFKKEIYLGMIGFLFDLCQHHWRQEKEFWTTAQSFYDHLHSLIIRYSNLTIEPLPLEETKFEELLKSLQLNEMPFAKQLKTLEIPDDMLLKQFNNYCGAYSERIRLLKSGKVLNSDFDKAERELQDRWSSIGDDLRLKLRKALSQLELSDYHEIMRLTLHPQSFNLNIGRVKSEARYLHNGIYHQMANGDNTKSPIYWHRNFEEDKN
ncbi:ABC-three component system protein [Pseudomonas oryzihabitans]|uniref:ABC-three component system protein n=1 Tax=Pseudomonas oryzihabitans TaxID=47885 RepID=UPI003CF0D73A